MGVNKKIMNIQVLMSTYNGQKYLKDQIDSILKQSGVNVSLLIRDDGSTDETRYILEKYEKKYENIQVVYGNNIGWKNSFIQLLRLSGDTEYFAFSDQDDVWLQDKLSSAVTIMRESGYKGAVLYHSISKYVDENLNELKNNRIYEEPLNGNEALLNAWTQGSNMVLNRELRDLCIRHIPSSHCAHDMWVYLVAYFMGHIIFDKHAHILYRQHGQNVTGGNALSGRKFSSRFRQAIKRLQTQDLYVNYGKELYIGYKDCLNEESQNLLIQWAQYQDDIKIKYRLLKDRTVKRRTLIGTICLKCAIMFSKV